MDLLGVKRLRGWCSCNQIFLVRHRDTSHRTRETKSIVTEKLFEVRTKIVAQVVFTIVKYFAVHIINLTLLKYYMYHRYLLCVTRWLQVYPASVLLSNAILVRVPFKAHCNPASDEKKTIVVVFTCLSLFRSKCTPRNHVFSCIAS